MCETTFFSSSHFFSKGKSSAPKSPKIFDNGPAPPEPEKCMNTVKTGYNDSGYNDNRI